MSAQPASARISAALSASSLLTTESAPFPPQSTIHHTRRLQLYIDKANDGAR